MTYREWTAATVSRFGISAGDVDLILVNRQDLITEPDADVDPAIAKRALVTEFAALIPLANVTEGGYSVSWNWEAIKFWYNTTCDELGITPQGKPRIRNRSNRW